MAKVDKKSIVPILFLSALALIGIYLALDHYVFRPAQIDDANNGGGTGNGNGNGNGSSDTGGTGQTGGGGTQKAGCEGSCNPTDLQACLDLDKGGCIMSQDARFGGCTPHCTEGGGGASPAESTSTSWRGTRQRKEVA